MHRHLPQALQGRLAGRYRMLYPDLYWLRVQPAVAGPAVARLLTPVLPRVTTAEPGSDQEVPPPARCGIAG